MDTIREDGTTEPNETITRNCHCPSHGRDIRTMKNPGPSRLSGLHYVKSARHPLPFPSLYDLICLIYVMLHEPVIFYVMLHEPVIFYVMLRESVVLSELIILYETMALNITSNPTIYAIFKPRSVGPRLIHEPITSTVTPPLSAGLGPGQSWSIFLLLEPLCVALFYDRISELQIKAPFMLRLDSLFIYNRSTVSSGRDRHELEVATSQDLLQPRDALARPANAAPTGGLSSCHLSLMFTNVNFLELATKTSCASLASSRLGTLPPQPGYPLLSSTSRPYWTATSYMTARHDQISPDKPP